MDCDTHMDDSSFILSPRCPANFMDVTDADADFVQWQSSQTTCAALDALMAEAALPVRRAPKRFSKEEPSSGTSRMRSASACLSFSSTAKPRTRRARPVRTPSSGSLQSASLDSSPDPPAKNSARASRPAALPSPKRFLDLVKGVSKGVDTRLNKERGEFTRSNSAAALGGPPLQKCKVVDDSRLSEQGASPLEPLTGSGSPSMLSPSLTSASSQSSSFSASFAVPAQTSGRRSRSRFTRTPSQVAMPPPPVPESRNPSGHLRQVNRALQSSLAASTSAPGIVAKPQPPARTRPLPPPAPTPSSSAWNQSKTPRPSQPPRPQVVPSVCRSATSHMAAQNRSKPPLLARGTTMPATRFEMSAAVTACPSEVNAAAVLEYKSELRPTISAEAAEGTDPDRERKEEAAVPRSPAADTDSSFGDLSFDIDVLEETLRKYD